MIRPIRTVLFDFDGTLADTLPLSFKAFKAVFLKYDNRSVTEEEIVAMFGPTEDDIIARNLRNTAAIEQAVQDYYDIYESGHFDERQNNQDISQLLQTLKSRGIRIGVVTGKSRKGFEISSAALQLSDYWEVSITGDDVERPKPHPEGVEKALELLQADKEEAVFLGDSNADIKAGKTAGLRTYGVQWLSTYQSATFETPPDRVFTRVQEFLDELL
ncbi:HAD family hydrolase [Paenibacillus silvisoli]|uniref:HAD family hydrolase n=1 Tax=Paenibacillus silvisoli TaxID=3110539 RepID=UPI0028061149|nr:HAD family hydrolase [Paenibacillus silvisoli]